MSVRLGSGRICDGGRPQLAARNRLHGRQPALLGGQPLLPPYCWRQRGSSRKRRSVSVLVRSTYGWPPDDGPLVPLKELRSKLKPLGVAFRQAVQALWAAQRQWLQHALARVALGLGLLAGAATLAANLWGVPALNRQLVPQVQQAAAALLQREVQLGGVRWVSAAGLAGVTPLASLGPISLGPGPVEGSSASVQRVTVGVDPLRSALQRKVVLTIKTYGAQVDLVQAGNYSWFGFPEDTTPSARNFLPGADDNGSDGGGGGSGGGSTGTGSTPTGGGAGSSAGRAGPAAAGGSSIAASASATSSGSSGKVATLPAAAPPVEARQRLEALAGQAASSSQQLQVLIERLTRELTQGAALQAQQGGGGVGGGSEQQPAVVLMGLGGAGTGGGAGQPWRQQQSSGVQPSSSAGLGGSSSGSTLCSEQQARPAGREVQELPRAAKGSGDGSGGVASSLRSFGSKLGWPLGPSAGGGLQPDGAPPPPARPVGAPGGRGTRRQRQVAALNTLRLQAGRGYSVHHASPAAAGTSARPAALPAAASRTHKAAAEAAQAASAGSAATAAQPSGVTPSAGPSSTGPTSASTTSSNIGGSSSRHVDVEQQQPVLAGHRSSTAPCGSEQQQGQQEQQQGLQRIGVRGRKACSPQDYPWALAHRVATSPGARPGSRRPGSSSSSSSPATGTAASLSQLLRPVQVQGGKLYTAAAPDRHPLQAATAGAVAASEAAAAELAAQAGGPAAADAVLPALPAPMTAEQRKAAVARINGLPTILVQQQSRQQPEAAADAAAASSGTAAGGAAAAAGEQEVEEARPADSPATRWINGLGTLEAPDSLKPSARVSRPARQALASVVDPATMRKKVGSASLPWSQQRAPASTLISKLNVGRAGAGRVQQLRGFQADADAGPDASGAAGLARHPGSAMAWSAGVEGDFQLAEPAPDSESETSRTLVGDGSSSSSSGKQAASAGAGSSARRQQLMHPGYYTAAGGPTYTPAPPEALIDARNRRFTLQAFLRSALEAAVSKLAVPEVAVGDIHIQGATVDAHVHGEALPRRFQDVSASLRLGRDYDSLAIDLAALPHERHASSAKCTMPSPHAHRHLRHVTGLAALRQHQEQEGQERAAAAAASQATATPGAATAAAGGGQPSGGGAALPTKPTGGRLRVRVKADHIATGVMPAHGQPVSPGLVVPSLDIRVGGQSLHAPLIERLIELPMDISAGRADGELRIYSHDAASWNFPEFYGRVNVRGAEFHFWDATDDIGGADLDLVFEGDRLYLHNTTGFFGAVPMTLTGDLELNPLTGHYHLSASIPGVEVNQLRATLGVRPTPQPVAGSVAGVLHVTGPLEKPVFSGTAAVVRPTPQQLADCEPTEALAALAAEPAAVGAYDRVPVSAAGAVFALDTAQETMMLHAMHAELVDGGQLHGSGRMWVAPQAEMDPSAVSIKVEGQELAAEAVAQRYMPEGLAPPPGMVVGRASLAASMKGSHLEPTLELALELPDASASCAATLRRTAASVSLKSPHADAKGTLHLQPPSFEAVKAAVTQAQATALAPLNVSGLDADVDLKGLDAVPLVSDEVALRQLAVQSGQPLRLKLNGKVKVSGTVRHGQQQQHAAAAAAAEANFSGGSGGGPRSTGGATTAAGSSSGGGGSSQWVFAGDLGLETVRVNQLKLFQKLAGRLTVSDSGISVHGKGQRNETLDLDLALPLLSPPQTPALTVDARPAERMTAAAAAAGVVQEPSIAEEPAAAATTAAAAEPQPGAESSVPTATAAVPEVMAAADQAQPAVQRGGGCLQLRCGPLQVAANVNAAGSQLDFKVAALKLDELELASLRGDLQEVSCSLNFDSHTGRGKLSLANPRYSGLRGDNLSGGFRWERDVVRLEKVVLQQQRSRYEVQGEYTIPPNTPLPSSAADLALQPGTGGGPAVAPAAASGRWRMQVSVPAAELQEIIPAARLLQTATSLSPADYERAKASFLKAVEQSNLKAAELNTQLRQMAAQLQPAAAGGSSPGSGSSGGPGAPRQDVGRGSAGLQLPGLQDMRGQWSGSIQAYGGGSSATSCDFDVKGQSWHWGAYALDSLVANGSYHSEEGVQLQEFELKAGSAVLKVTGSLLGDNQNAKLRLADFPMATLRPVFRAMPALQYTAPAVPAERPQPVASPRPLGMLTSALGRATKGLQEGGDADSPINGMLHIQANLTGSNARPTGEVVIRLFDAAVGPTRLSKAEARARLNEQQSLHYEVEVVPTEGHRQSGYVRASGDVPLADATTSAGSGLGGSSGNGGGSGSNRGKEAAGQQNPRPQGGGIGSVAVMPPQQQQDLLHLQVKDSGMSILTSVTPDVRWQQGLAHIDVRLRGTLEQPVLSGGASISKATLDCPLLRFPLTNVSAEVHAGNDQLTVDSLEARCGRRGYIKARGSLPVYGSGGGGDGRGRPLLQQAQLPQQQQQQRLLADVSGLEVRLRNLYSGQYDATLQISGSLASPAMAGKMHFSKGFVFLVPQGAPDVGGTGSGGSNTLLTSAGAASQHQAGSVAKVFDILTRGESGLAQQFEAVMKQEVEAVEHMVEDAGQHNLALQQLAICLGPDLRAVYPLVMNFAVEGQLSVSGPAHPDQVCVFGTLRLPSGDVNLVATQLALDREHANLITFQSDQSGLDPLVDLVMKGGDLRVAIQGKASEWQDHLTLHYISNKAQSDSGEQLDAADAARIFEDKLKAALLAEDGQLALSRLAGTTVSTLMPKIETQGQVGGARWRLVSAPSIPGLLSLDPSLADPSNILSSITMGTEVEIQFGKKLQAAMIRKLQESDVTTQWSLNYKLNNKLRMQFNITSAPPFPKTLMFQYSSEGSSS